MVKHLSGLCKALQIHAVHKGEYSSEHEVSEKFIVIKVKCLLEDGHANIFGIGVNVHINLD
jgi:hypothetical protein